MKELCVVKKLLDMMRHLKDRHPFDRQFICEQVARFSPTYNTYDHSFGNHDDSSRITPDEIGHFKDYLAGLDWR